MKMSGSRALIDIFCQQGVEYVFGIPGATEVYFMGALEDCPQIKYILGLHEVVCAGMAEGYARASGKPGVLNLHTGTGLGAALPMLSNAWTGGVPLVITAGQQDTRLHSYEPHLTGDLAAMARPFTKWATEISHPEDIPAVLRRAFKVATHLPTGPVFVSLPMDVMAAEVELDAEGPSSPWHTCADPEAVAAAADLLAHAKNPALVVQDGVAKSDALDEAVALAELVGARVYQPWMGDVNFPVSHPLYIGDIDLHSLSTRDLLAKVDVLVAIGLPLFAQAIHLPQQLLTPQTALIHIDDNAWEIGKNYPVAVGVEGNIKEAVAAINSALEEKTMDPAKAAVAERIKTISAEKRQSDEAFQARAQREKDAVPIAPSRLMQEIRDALKPGTRVVDDCWSSSAVLRRTFAFSEPKSYMRSRNGGSIGWGLPGAVGVKLASPDRPVVCVSGDGSAMWSVQTLWTAARYQVPVTFIICANGRYQQVRVMRDALLGPGTAAQYIGTSLTDPQIDFCRLAEGMGLQARRVEQPRDLAPALREAFALDRPHLVEVRLGV